MGVLQKSMLYSAPESRMTTFHRHFNNDSLKYGSEEKRPLSGLSNFVFFVHPNIQFTIESVRCVSYLDNTCVHRQSMVAQVHLTFFQKKLTHTITFCPEVIIRCMYISTSSLA